MALALPISELAPEGNIGQKVNPMPRYFPNPDEFHSIARSADLVPVYRQLLADHLTPVTAFELLGKQEHALLLESVVGNEKIGRYSFIASGPKLTYHVKDGRASIRHHGNSKQAASEFATKDPLGDLAKLLPQRRYYTRIFRRSLADW